MWCGGPSAVSTASQARWQTVETRQPIVFVPEIHYPAHMKTIFAGFVGLLLLVVLSCDGAAAENPFTGGKWIDLSHDFSAQTLYWPTAENFALETEFNGQTPKGYFYAA